MAWRIVSGLAAGAVAVMVILAGGWTFALTVCGLAVAGCIELKALMASKGVDYPLAAVCVGCVGVVGAAGLGRPDLFAPITAVVLVWLMASQAVAGRVPGALVRPGVGAFGVLYVGWPLAALVALRNAGTRVAMGRGLSHAGGAGLVLLVLLTVWGTDTAAFFGGMALGRARPWPKVSPTKSVEGAVCGTVVGLAVGVATIVWGPGIGLLVPRPGALSYALVAIVVVVGQLGDLAESALKRDAKVKDSGVFLPGHGGFLDRLDSVLAASLAAYYYLVVTGLLTA